MKIQLDELTKEELATILDNHAKWLNGVDGGIRADLSYTDLSYTDLRYADLRSADLSYTDLRYADLRSADLRYADLRSADLRYADLDKRYIQVSCIGFVKSMTTYCFDDDIIWSECFTGTLESFERQVNETHQNNERYLKEYLGFINYVKSLK